MRKILFSLIVLVCCACVSCEFFDGVIIDRNNPNPFVFVDNDDEQGYIQDPYYELQYDVEYQIGDVGPCGGIIIYDVDADNVYEDRREGDVTWVSAMPGKDCLVSGICGYRYVEVMPYDLTTVETRVAYVEGDHTTGVLKLIDDCNNANTLGTNDWRVPMEHEIYAFFDLVWEDYYTGDQSIYNTTSKDAGLGWNTRPDPNTGRILPYINGANWPECHYWVNVWPYQTGMPETVMMDGRPNFYFHGVSCRNTAVVSYFNLRLVRSF